MDTTSGLLTSIRDAEAKAEQMTQTALKDKAKALDDARKKALELVSEADTEIQKANDARLAAVEKELEKKRAKIIAAAQENVAEVAKIGKKNVEKAAEFLVDEFQKMVE